MRNFETSGGNYGSPHRGESTKNGDKLLSHETCSLPSCSSLVQQRERPDWAAFTRAIVPRRTVRAGEQNQKRRAFAYSRFIILEVRQLRKHSDNHLDDRRERAGGRRDFILRRCSVSNRDTFNHSKSNQTLFPINLKQHK